MTHLVIDADTMAFKAAAVVERTVYDIVPLHVEHQIVHDDYESYQQFVIQTFKYVKEYTEWLKKHGKTKDDFLRISRKTYEPVSHAFHIVNMSMNELINRIEPEQVTVLLSGKQNFRDEVATIRPYKETRKDKPKPDCLPQVEQFMIDRWGAIRVEGIEADDMCAIVAYSSIEDGAPYVIAHVDKDLRMIPGMHYDYDKQSSYYVNDWDALKWFYIQLLAGDSTDCIPGLYGYAEKTARSALAKSKTEKGMFKKALELYGSDAGRYKDKYYANDPRGAIGVLKEMANLVHMRKFDGDVWAPPA